jgi:hypothetical protein
MSGTADRLRLIRQKWSTRLRERRATRAERELRRADARALRHDHATFDEGRRGPDGPGGI